jgi:hypothetical protein
MSVFNLPAESFEPLWVQSKDVDCVHDSYIDCPNGDGCGRLTMLLGVGCFVCGAPDWTSV